jgi:hypothetical protein
MDRDLYLLGVLAAGSDSSLAGIAVKGINEGGGDWSACEMKD